MGYSFVSHGGSARMSTLIVDGDLDMSGFDILGATSVSGSAVSASGDITASGSLIGAAINVPLCTHSPASPEILYQLTHTLETFPTADVWVDAYTITLPDTLPASPNTQLGDIWIGFGAEVSSNHATGTSSYRVIDSGGVPVAEWIDIVTGTGYVDLSPSSPILITPGDTYTFQTKRHYQYAYIKNPKIYGVPTGASPLGDSGSMVPA